jgi:hypothetical protein
VNPVSKISAPTTTAAAEPATPWRSDGSKSPESLLADLPQREPRRANGRDPRVAARASRQWSSCRVVNCIDGLVALLHTNMPRAQLRRSLLPQEIASVNRVGVMPLRGKIRAVDVLDIGSGARWAEWLRERQVVYLDDDCLRPVVDALGLYGRRESGRWLPGFNGERGRAHLATPRRTTVVRSSLVCAEAVSSC